MSYKIKIKKGARKDLRIKGNYLEKNFSKLVDRLKDNPYQNNQSFRKTRTTNSWFLFSTNQYTVSGCI